MSSGQTDPTSAAFLKTSQVAADAVPWGEPPTPLLPGWYRGELSETELPDHVRPFVWGPPIETVGELCDFWTEPRLPEEEDVLDSSEPLSFLKSLVRDRGWPPEHMFVFPPGMNRSDIRDYPLGARTLFALHRADLLKGDDGICVADLVSAEGFGFVSLIELMCVVEAVIGDLSFGVTTHDTADEERVSSSGPALGTAGRRDWLGPIGTLLAVADEFYGATTVREALSLNLASVAEKTGIASDLGALRIVDVTAGRRIADSIVDKLNGLSTSFSERERLIIDRRVGRSSPQTLDALGIELNVSRERVRQVQRAIRDKIEDRVGREIRIVAGTLRDQMGPVVADTYFDTLVATVFAGDPAKNTGISLAIQLLRSRLNYTCANGICFDQTAKDVIQRLRHDARKLSDDLGLVEEEALRSRLPDSAWSPYFFQLVECAGLHRIERWIALRNTIRARIKVALCLRTRPATLEEIAISADLKMSQLRSQLPNIPGVVKATKTTWGLAERIDDEYEGIPAEIIQRINEDGGATSMERLVEELPRKFGVKEGSVRACVGTAQFVLRDGYVSMADESSVRLSDLADAVDGYTDDGNPYWTFPIESRYLDGYSLPNLPPELARALGCEPNGKIRVDVEYPEGCPPLSVSWRLTSASGAGLGYIARPLERLGLRAGDRVRLVIKGRGLVELHPQSRTPSSVDAKPSSASALLERLKSRRRVV